MTVIRGLASVAMLAAAALLLAGCSAASSGSAGSSEPAAKPAHTAVAEVPPQPFNSGKLLAGDASPAFPDGDMGKVSVVAEGTLKPKSVATLPIAFRNNTDKAIANVAIKATALVGGVSVATGRSAGTTPVRVQPGEIGLAVIYFDVAASLPDTGVTYRYSVKASAVDTAKYSLAPLVPTEVTNDGSSIVGSATNKTGKEVTGFSVDVYCFDGSTITGESTGVVEDAPYDTVTFSVNLFDIVCPTYALGVAGYFD